MLVVLGTSIPRPEEASKHRVCNNGAVTGGGGENLKIVTIGQTLAFFLFIYP